MVEGGGLDPWAVLGVPRQASQEEIKKAFRAACKAHHPDLVADPALRPQAEQRMQAINAAYTRLTSTRGWDAAQYQSSPGFRRPWAPGGASPQQTRFSSAIFAIALAMPFFMVGLQMMRSEPGTSDGVRAPVPVYPNQLRPHTGYKRTH